MVTELSRKLILMKNYNIIDLNMHHVGFRTTTYIFFLQWYGTQLHTHTHTHTFNDLRARLISIKFELINDKNTQSVRWYWCVCKLPGNLSSYMPGKNSV